MTRPTFPRSSVLVIGHDSIQSLVPSTLVSQLESLLEGHRLEDAFNLADQRRKKLQESITIDEDEVNAFICLQVLKTDMNFKFRRKSYVTCINALDSSVLRRLSSKMQESICLMEN